MDGDATGKKSAPDGGAGLERAGPGRARPLLEYGAPVTPDT